MTVFQSHDLDDILHQCRSGAGVGFRAIVTSSLFIRASLSLTIRRSASSFRQHLTFSDLNLNQRQTLVLHCLILITQRFLYEARLYPVSADDRGHCLPEL